MRLKKVEENLIKLGHLQVKLDLNVDYTACVFIQNGLGEHKGKLYTSCLSPEETNMTTEEVTRLLTARVHNEFYGWAVRKGYRTVN